MFGQTFDLIDLLRIAFLSLLEISLSADNAIILGLLAYSLPIGQRKKALFIGLISSFVIRGISILAASLLLRFIWIQVIGALYLIYLSIRYFWKGRLTFPSLKGSVNFWKTVLLIEFFDFAFAIDSIIATVAFISTIPSIPGKINPKLWIVYVGAILGLITMRFAAKLFSELISRFSRLETAAHLMIGWIGFKLGLIGLKLLPESLSFQFEVAFWVVLILFFIFGFTKDKRKHV